MGTVCALAAILVCASALRLARLGHDSLWYDEVVTMRLARSEGPAALVRLLDRIDATRAPLHPLLLQGWVALFGSSDVAGRAFSVLCGVATVALVFRIGERAHDAKTGLWAAWLCAWSPPLVYYSRETRMYAWLVLVTCGCWLLLLSSRSATTALWRIGYALGLAALVLSHPLGILMALTLAIASLAGRSAFGLSVKDWLLLHAAPAILVAPWLPRYVDHPPAYLIGRLPLRFLLGLPIGFVGGNFGVLAACAALVGFGIWHDLRRRDISEPGGGDRRAITQSSLIWFALPPVMLYAYSWVAHPLFGPARYTLFVGPAYLLLLARGLALLPIVPRLAGGAALLALSVALLRTMVYAPDLKADWRGAAAYLDRSDPAAPVVVVNASADAAEYYLGAGRRVRAMPAKVEDLAALLDADPSAAWYAIERTVGRPPGVVPEFLADDMSPETSIDFEGLRLVKKRPRPAP